MWEPGPLNDHEEQSLINDLGNSSQVFLMNEKRTSVLFKPLHFGASLLRQPSVHLNHMERLKDLLLLPTFLLLQFKARPPLNSKPLRVRGLQVAHEKSKLLNVENNKGPINQSFGQSTNMSENCLFSAWERERCISGKGAGKEAPFFSTFDVLGGGLGIYRRNPKFMLVRAQPQDCCYFAVQMK